MTLHSQKSLLTATITLVFAACGTGGAEPQPTSLEPSGDRPAVVDATEGESAPEQAMQNSDAPPPSARPPSAGPPNAGPPSVPPYQRSGGVNVEVGDRLVELVVRGDGRVEIHLIRSVEQPRVAVVEISGTDGASHRVSLAWQGDVLVGAMSGVRPAPGPATVTLADSTGDSSGRASSIVIS